ncbi:zinc finger protein 410 isoform X2 [Clupea harengus]|uniref:Zinc finger protein 410 n=1 Tax=Clupea harengus TaxID=7950 RepID=A0A6P8GKN1_CLUHA|nr:zinc finger protein 410 isoform X2 [Clupea harengus]
MLSDELDSKPELLVEFVQNASIPLGQGLEEPDTCPKNTCLPLQPLPADNSICSHLQLTERTLSHAGSTELCEFGAERSAMVVQLHPRAPSPGSTHVNHAAVPVPNHAPIMQDLQQQDSTSYVLLNLAKGLAASAESLVFVQDEAEEEISAGEGGDGSAPWYLRVQELAHDSLIAATRAQLAKDAKDARANSNGEHLHGYQSEGPKKEQAPHGNRGNAEKVLRCPYENCHRTFTWPAHLKYHLKTHRNDRTFRCGAEGCGKSFYVLQRLQVHMRTHNGEKPYTCPERGCGKRFTTAGNLKNHRRTHTGEKPFLCEVDSCGRSFAEYSSLRKHMLVHSGEKPHQCGVCGKTFSQSGSRNVHMRKRHGEESLGPEGTDAGEALTHSSILEADGAAAGDAMVTMTTVEPMNVHHAMLRGQDSVVVLSPPHDLVSMTTGGHPYVEMNLQ